MNPLLLWLEKNGMSKLAKVVAENPGKTALAAGTGLAGAGVGGAYLGSQATVNAIPHELLTRLGLSDSMADDIEGSVTDAMAYAEKHPIAAAAIGASALKGGQEFGSSALDKFRELVGAGGGDSPEVYQGTPRDFERFMKHGRKPR